MALIYLYKGLSITKDFTILDGFGTVIVPGANDKIRAYIGREGQLGTNLSGAKFLVTSDAPTANRSTFSKNTPSSGKNRLRWDSQDLALINAGVYTLFIEYFDAEDTDPEDPTPQGEWKCVSRQVLVVEDT